MIATRISACVHPSMMKTKHHRALCVVRAAADDENIAQYKKELKNLIKNIQTRKMEQMQEIKTVQQNLLGDFKDFHVATLKIYQNELQKKIDKIESDESSPSADTPKTEVIDTIDITE